MHARAGGVEQRQDLSLLPRARHEKYVLLIRKGLRVALGGAAAHGNARVRGDGADARDRLPALLFRLARHGAGIEYV